MTGHLSALRLYSVTELPLKLYSRTKIKQHCGTEANTCYSLRPTVQFYVKRTNTQDIKDQESWSPYPLQACFPNTVNIQDQKMKSLTIDVIVSMVVSSAPASAAAQAYIEMIKLFHSRANSTYLACVSQQRINKGDFSKDSRKNILNQLVSCKHVSRGTTLQRQKILSQ